FSGSADKCLIFQLSGGTGGKEVIVAINFSSSTLKVDHEINLVNGLVVGSELYDLAGNSAFPYAVVSSSNQIYIELPPRSWSVWVQGNPVAPLAPSSLKIESASDARFALSWTDNSPNESNFVLERKDGSGGTWTTVSSPVADTTFYVDSTAFNSTTTYFYRIKASNTAGDSDYSNELSSRPYITWQGFSTDWNDPANWMHFVLPDSTCDVVIPASTEGGNFPTGNSGVYGKVRKLKLESGSELDIPAGKILEVIKE
ncbi:MAG: fibronectin type III domain-containing protein, partial [Bacteroidales bacterium]|nr:fibronectin type III domain-containing protein [Bacteroidales bacterium]